MGRGYNVGNFSLIESELSTSRAGPCLGACSQALGWTIPPSEGYPLSGLGGGTAVNVWLSSTKRDRSGPDGTQKLIEAEIRFEITRQRLESIVISSRIEQYVASLNVSEPEAPVLAAITG